MKRIQQIVANVMCQLTEISLENRADGIKGMARDIQKVVNEASLQILGVMLTEIDEQLYHNKERQKKWEVVRKDDAKTIMTCVGELTYKRRYYRNKDTGEHKHLLDDWMDITPHQQIGEDVREDLVSSAVNVSYQKSGKQSAPKPVSKTSVGNYVGDVTVKAIMQSDGKKRICKELYVEADEDHVALQNGKNVQVRLVYVHEGNISETKRAQLGHVRYLTWPIGGDTDDMWETVATYIEEQYDTDQLQKVWLCGDGAAWIDKGAEWLIKCEKLLDRYHVNKRFMSLTAQIPHLRGWGRQVLKKGTKAQINVLYEHAAEKADTKNKQEQLVEDTRYLLSHWEQITAGRAADAPGCSAEGHVSHVLSARLSSRPMGWSITGLEQMAALRVMDANGTPIIYERKKPDTGSSFCLAPEILSAASVNIRSKTDSAMKNIRLPILAAGQYTPTYTALKGLAYRNTVL
ncbi:MAG: ISLre2 family transposase [Veillonellaceae bacterium]|nr:ISLre2 family transposase [Veillonellaceae bacterium]